MDKKWSRKRRIVVFLLWPDSESHLSCTSLDEFGVGSDSRQTASSLELKRSSFLPLLMKWISFFLSNIPRKKRKAAALCSSSVSLFLFQLQYALIIKDCPRVIPSTHVVLPSILSFYLFKHLGFPECIFLNQFKKHSGKWGDPLELQLLEHPKILNEWLFNWTAMNKGGGTGGGPTAAAAAAAAQKQKTLLQRVETDIANVVDNFTLLVNVARVPFLYFILFSSFIFFITWYNVVQIYLLILFVIFVFFYFFYFGLR